jgi:hydrogenase maturation protease
VADVVVIGVGNPYRCDDGVGPAVAAAVAAHRREGVKVVTCANEPTVILDAWAGATLAVVVDAAVGGSPGRVRVGTLENFAEPVLVSSHDLSLRQTYELAAVLGRAPQALLVVTVDVAEVGHGEGLSPAVAAALPAAVRAVLAVIGDRVLKRAEKTAHQQS